jgi:hypothetical protein
VIITNELNLPDAFVKAVSTDQHNAENSLSCTTLLKGIKEIVLTERWWESMSDDASQRIWAIFGQAVHLIFEKYGDKEYTELSLEHNLHGINITGRIDYYDIARGIIFDYKTISLNKIKFQDFSDWRRQGLIYAWLLNKNGFPANQMRFIALLKDHSKTKAMYDREYPQRPVVVYEKEIGPENLTQAECFIEKKIYDYQIACDMSDDTIPPCEPEERWERPEKYAVKKMGMKRAVKLFDELNEAENHALRLGKGHYVEHRPGESIKCQYYCMVKNYCNFYRKHVLRIEE